MWGRRMMIAASMAALFACSGPAATSDPAPVTTPSAATTASPPATTSSEVAGPATTAAPGHSTADPEADSPTGSIARSERPWPGPETTGPTDEAALAPSESVETTEDGQVIEDLEVTGTIVVRHDDVTIRNVRVLGTERYGVQVPAELHEEVSGLVLEDVEIRGVSGDRSAGLVHYGSWTARRVDVSGYQDGVKMVSDQVLEDSWIHDLFAPPGAHNDGVQSVGGSSSVIRGNNIINEHGQTSAVLLLTNNEPMDGWTVAGNRFEGGGYSFYLQDKGNGFGAPTNMTVRDNIWVRGSWQYGPISVGLGEGLTWTGNSYDDGAVLTLG